MHACTHTCQHTYTFMHACIHTCIHTNIYIQTHGCVPKYINANTQAYSQAWLATNTHGDSCLMATDRNELMFVCTLLYIHKYMQTYIHNYIHVYINACLHTVMHDCIHTYIHTHTLLGKYIYIQSSTSIQHTYIYISIHVCIQMHMCVHGHIHTYMCAYIIYMYMHSHSCIKQLNRLQFICLQTLIHAYIHTCNSYISA